jgi:anti-sigma B factor antagonist
MGFAVDTSWIDGCAVVSVEGEIDLSAEPYIRDRLRDALAEAREALVIDLSRTTFMDARGIAVLVAARSMSQRARVALRVVGVSPRIRRMLAAVGLDRAFRPLTVPPGGSDRVT